MFEEENLPSEQSDKKIQIREKIITNKKKATTVYVLQRCTEHPTNFISLETTFKSNVCSLQKTRTIQLNHWVEIQMGER